MTKLTTWAGSLHQTFRLVGAQSRSLKPFLDSHGRTPEEILAILPYDAARAASSGGGSGGPDPKRYRDARQVYQTAGLVYETDGGILQVTELGRAVGRWLPIINPINAPILARHAAYALSACQLRNPSGSGSRYDPSMEVFPFQFIWKAMLQLDLRISSDELNRGIFRTTSEKDLRDAVTRIRASRESHDHSMVGDEVIVGEKKNDRIIPWLSLASFGWTIFGDKQEDGYYHLPRSTLSVIKEAASIRHRHREFGSVREYVELVSNCASLPKDLR